MNKGPPVGAGISVDFHRSNLPAYNALNRKENYQQKMMLVQAPGREYRVPDLSVSQLEF